MKDHERSDHGGQDTSSEGHMQWVGTSKNNGRHMSVTGPPAAPPRAKAQSIIDLSLGILDQINNATANGPVRVGEQSDEPNPFLYETRFDKHLHGFEPRLVSEVVFSTTFDGRLRRGTDRLRQLVACFAPSLDKEGCVVRCQLNRRRADVQPTEGFRADIKPTTLMNYVDTWHSAMRYMANASADTTNAVPTPCVVNTRQKVAINALLELTDTSSIDYIDATLFEVFDAILSQKLYNDEFRNPLASFTAVLAIRRGGYRWCTANDYQNPFAALVKLSILMIYTVAKARTGGKMPGSTENCVQQQHDAAESTQIGVEPGITDSTLLPTIKAMMQGVVYIPTSEGYMTFLSWAFEMQAKLSRLRLAEFSAPVIEWTKEGEMLAYGMKLDVEGVRRLVGGVMDD